MDSKQKDNIIHPSEILENNPELKKIWTANDIGILLRMKLISGKKLIRGCIVSENDVLKIYELVKK